MWFSLIGFTCGIHLRLSVVVRVFEGIESVVLNAEEPTSTLDFYLDLVFQRRDLVTIRIDSD